MNLVEIEAAVRDLCRQASHVGDDVLITVECQFSRHHGTTPPTTEWTIYVGNDSRCILRESSPTVSGVLEAVRNELSGGKLAVKEASKACELSEVY